jgi:tetratricopeptide (TPR) repeat protein
MVIIAYTPALRGGFIWDDDRYVTENPTLASPNGLLRIWFELGATVQYYPLVFSTFWVEHALWGLHPFGYHLVNVILHAANALLLWMILRRLSVPGAWVAAAFFALHPVNVESVAWVTERKNVLSGMFYLAAAAAYLRYAGLDDPAGRTGGGRWYGASLVLFVCALLSKTVVCSLPAVLLLVSCWKRGRIAKFEVWRLVPFFAVGFCLAALTTWMEKYNVGAAGEAWRLSLLDRLLIAGRALFFYAGKLLWPANLCFIYPRWKVDAATPCQYLYPVGVIVVLLGLWTLRRRIGLGPLVAVLCFAGTLAPALGFIDFYPMRYSFVADHFQYLASIFPITLIVGVAATAIRRLDRRTARSTILIAAAALVVCGVLTCRQGLAYWDLTALWTDTLQKNPACWMAHNNLGAILRTKGDGRAAMEHFQTAARLNPDFREAHFNCAQQFQAGGQYAAAAAEYREVLRLKPDHRAARMSLAMVLCESGQMKESVAQLIEVLQAEPELPEALYNLGRVYHLHGQPDEAVRYYRATLHSDPTHANAHYNLGQILAARGEVDGAIDHWREASRLRAPWPEANYNLGRALMMKGHLDEAARNFRETLRVDPRYLRARIAVAQVLAEQGDPDGARQELGEALKQEPNNSEARKLLERLTPGPGPNR